MTRRGTCRYCSLCLALFRSRRPDEHSRDRYSLFFSTGNATIVTLDAQLCNPPLNREFNLVLRWDEEFESNRSTWNGGLVPINNYSTRYINGDPVAPRRTFLTRITWMLKLKSIGSRFGTPKALASPWIRTARRRYILCAPGSTIFGRFGFTIALLMCYPRASRLVRGETKNRLLPPRQGLESTPKSVPRVKPRHGFLVSLGLELTQTIS